VGVTRCNKTAVFLHLLLTEIDVYVNELIHTQSHISV